MVWDPPFPLFSELLIQISTQHLEWPSGLPVFKIRASCWTKEKKSMLQSFLSFSIFVDWWYILFMNCCFYAYKIKQLHPSLVASRQNADAMFAILQVLKRYRLPNCSFLSWVYIYLYMCILCFFVLCKIRSHAVSSEYMFIAKMTTKFTLVLTKQTFRFKPSAAFWSQKCDPVV